MNIKEFLLNKMNIRQTFLSTVLIFLSVKSLSSVKAQQNTDGQCLDNYRKQTVILQGEPIEKSRWYKDRRVTFEDWRNTNNYSFTIRENYQAEVLVDQGFEVRYYTHGIYYTVGLNPTLEVPKYSEEEVIKQCQ